MRVMTPGCTARRAWSTLLRDRRLADLSVVSDFAAISTGLVEARRLAWADRSDRSGVVTARCASAGTATGSGASASLAAGALKLVAGSTGRSTSAT